MTSSRRAQASDLPTLATPHTTPESRARRKSPNFVTAIKCGVVSLLAAGSATSVVHLLGAGRTRPASDKHLTEGLAKPQLPVHPMVTDAVVTQPCFGDAPQHELVLSRIDENMDWLFDVPDTWDITVYNEGAHDMPTWPTRPYTSIEVERHDFGRENYVFAQHIVRRYRSLADYTVFAQAEPFKCSPYFIQLLQQPERLQPVQALSLRARSGVPPDRLLQKFSPEPGFRADSVSLRTLDSIFFRDHWMAVPKTAYLTHHALPNGSNIIAHFVEFLGRQDWIPESQEVGTMAYASTFGASRENILQHGRSVYEKMAVALWDHDFNAWVVERSWLMLVGGARLPAAQLPADTSSSSRNSEQTQASSAS